MSEQPVYIAGFIPDEKSEAEFGARRVATAFTAKDIKHAKAKAAFMFMEEYPGSQDAAYKHLLCEAGVGISRPALGVWDENFLYEYEWSEELGYPVEIATNDPEEPINFEGLSLLMRISILVKYGTEEITKEMLPGALDLTQEDAGTFEGHIVEAINRTPEISSMYPERIINAIGWVKTKCEKNKKWPEIKSELMVWKKRLESKRTETSPSKSVVDIARQKAAESKLRTPSGATAGGGNPTDRGEGIESNFDMLALEVAMGVVARAMDFDIYNAGSGIVNRARDIIKLKERPFPAFYEALRSTPGILDYSRAMIVYAVKTAPESAESNAAEFQGHINRTMNETDHVNPDPRIIAALNGIVAEENDSSVIEQITGTSEAEAERAGPFYFLQSDGEKTGRANKLASLEKAIAGGATEISLDEYQARKNGTYVDPEEERKAREGLTGAFNERSESLAAALGESPQDKEVVTNLGNGRFSIEGLMGDQPKAQKEAGNLASNDVEKTEVDTKPETDYQVVAASIEKELADKPAMAQDNLQLWRTVMRTDPRFTKDISGTGFDGTSVNAEYMFMRATEMFGPLGSGWGVEIQEDKLIPGAPMREAIYDEKDPKKIIGHRLLRDADGTLFTELNHSIRINLWYETAEKSGSVIAFGATPYMYMTRTAGIKCDGEAQKKSLTDAMKKALSMLGFSADVWLGMYDRPEYVAEVGVEFGIKTASEKAEDSTRLRSELDEKLTRVANTIENAVSTNEAKKVFDTIAREVEVHRKSAEAKGDSEHAKYLSGRLRRLSQIKDQRINALTENQEQSA